MKTPQKSPKPISRPGAVPVTSSGFRGAQNAPKVTITPKAKTGGMVNSNAKVAVSKVAKGKVGGKSTAPKTAVPKAKYGMSMKNEGDPKKRSVETKTVSQSNSKYDLAGKMKTVSKDGEVVKTKIKRTITPTSTGKPMTTVSVTKGSGPDAPTRTRRGIIPVKAKYGMSMRKK